jgi:outer membrane receptor for ferrienterochelin and colicin
MAAALLSAFCVTPLHAQSSGDEPAAGVGNTLESVTVRARRSFDDRFESTASTLTVTRQDIESLGASTVVDVLRNLPGVQVTTNPNGGVEIRMRGMGAESTRVLIDGAAQSSTRRGQQLPLDELPADVIERVEVIRSPSAQFEGAAGGSINIVLRNAEQRRESLATVSNTSVWDTNATTFFVSQTGPLYASPVTGKADSTEPADLASRAQQTRWGYFISLTGGPRWFGSDTDRRSRVFDAAGNQLSDIDADDQTRLRSTNYTLVPRLNGRLGANDSVTVQGTFGFTDQTGQNTSYGGGFSTLQPFQFNALTPWVFTRDYYQGAVDWTHRFKGSRLESTLSVDRNASQYRFDRTTTSTLGGAVSSSTGGLDERRNERSWLVRSKWLAPLETGLFSAGTELERRQLDVDSTSTVAATPTSLDLSARIDRNALFAEVELPVTDWKSTITGGLRAQSYRLSSLYVGTQLDRDDVFLQPSLNSRTRLGPDTQLRVNLARVTRVPRIYELLNRTVPTVNTNTPNSPDFQGNPNVRPEATITLDVGIDQRIRNFGSGGVNLFVRQQSDIIGRRLSLQANRWTDRVDNIGDALVWGIEGDLRGNMQWAGLPRDWTMVATASLLFSRVTAGDNLGDRLPGQARYLANLTVSKPMRLSGGWYGGGTLALTGTSSNAAAATNGVVVSGSDRPYQQLDLFVGQVIAKLGFWRLNLNNVTNIGRDETRFVADSLNGLVYADQSVRRTGARVVFTVGTRF